MEGEEEGSGMQNKKSFLTLRLVKPSHPLHTCTYIYIGCLAFQHNTLMLTILAEVKSLE